MDHFQHNVSRLENQVHQDSHTQDLLPTGYQCDHQGVHCEK